MKRDDIGGTTYTFFPLKLSKKERTEMVTRKVINRRAAGEVRSCDP